MQKSDSIKNIGAALVKFHGEMGKVLKSDTNPFFRSKYATLSTILSAIKDPLQNAGLTFTQFPTGENELTSLIIHPDSGEWIMDAFKMTPARNDPQGQGSVITYQRRYALGAILGLNIDDDDDGNAASTPRAEAAAPARRGRRPVRGAEYVAPLADEAVPPFGNTTEED